MKPLPFSLYTIVLFSALSCSILKPEDPETKVRNFVMTLEQTLLGDDKEIMALFDTQQSKEAIMSAVRLLQNQTEYGIRCLIYPEDATIAFEDNGVRVIIPADISGMIDEENMSSEETTLTLILSPRKGSFVISSLEGDVFYNAYMNVKYALAEAASAAEVHQHILAYAKAVELLQQKYDTVVWVARYNETPYFYVVNGQWNDSYQGDFKMGLVDEGGNEIISASYDMVGTIGFDWSDIVEVRAGNYVGLFSLSNGQILPAEYESIIPYETDKGYAIVKSGETYGWLDNANRYHEGLPNDAAKAYLSSHDYLPTGREFSNSTMTLCEIPNEEYYGSGRLIFPAYLTSTGLFAEVEPGFSMYSGAWRGNTEAIATDHKFYESVLDGIGMLITSMTKRYLDGREAFYTTDEVSFVSSVGLPVGSSASLSSSDITINRIDSTLIEIVSAYRSEGYEMYDETTDETENNLPQYLYFRLDEGGAPQLLSSNRTFNYTEFVKLDSSYLSGNFTYIAKETFTEQSRTFLCDSSLMRMRNEILADYGFIFPDTRTTEHFKYFSWYQPRFEAIAEIEDVLSDIDRHNLKFLEVILGPVPGKEAI